MVPTGAAIRMRMAIRGECIEALSSEIRFKKTNYAPKILTKLR